MSFADPGLNLFNWLDGNRGAAVSFTVPNAIGAGDALHLAIDGVTNPGPGNQTLEVSTSTDVSASSSAPYTVSAAASVTAPDVSLSSPAAGAGGVTYGIGFSTSSTGAIPPGGSITLEAPGGTDWPAAANAYSLTDVTTPTGSFVGAQAVQLVEGGAMAVLTVPNTVAAGDALSLSVSGVTNPGAGAQTLTVATSTDLQASTSESYPVTGAPSTLTSVTSATLTTTTQAAGANGATYTLGFTTSGTGTLVGGSSAVTVVAPGGTVFGTCPYGDCGPRSTYTIDDLTNPADSASTTGGVTDGGSVVSVGVPRTIPAGDQVQLVITAVTNPPAGTGAVDLSTTADPAPVALADVTSTPNAVATPSVSTTSSSAGADGTTLSIGFTTSATGALVGGSSAVTLVAPGGTVFGTCPYTCAGGGTGYTFADLTHPSDSSSSNGPAVVGARREREPVDDDSRRRPGRVDDHLRDQPAAGRRPGSSCRRPRTRNRSPSPIRRPRRHHCPPPP